MVNDEEIIEIGYSDEIKVFQKFDKLQLKLFNKIKDQDALKELIDYSPDIQK
ncbi:MAG: hypothetical protein ACFFD2_07975 [Promethearchaeota archaeon]